ncbi:gamma-glutamyl-gamma-aminobutyrate hydrolase family protein [Candidatus Woesearchaeota archaeon]|nr:gamma-glutamyl-gamma-aminobutyrate hydrolase family protein [Candidatus Woesearchaeota archaeon]
MLLIIDNGSQKIKQFAGTLQEWDVPYKMIRGSNNADLRGVEGIILSGGSGHPAQRTDIYGNYAALLKTQVPVLGLCLGHEMIAHYYGGSLETLLKLQLGLQEVIIEKPDPLFPKRRYLLEKKHSYHVTTVPKDFVVLGYSAACPIEIIKHSTRPIYGIQGHPEVSEEGLEIMKDFLKMCGLKPK